MKKKFRENWLIIGFVLFLLAIININRLLPFPLAKNLLIDMISFFPDWQVFDEGTESIPQGPLGGRKTIHTATLTYTSKEGSVRQDVYQFKDCSDASEYYPQELPFRHVDGWVTLPEIEYSSPTALRSYFSCEQSTFEPQMTGCTYVAQYGVYVIVVDGSWLVDSQVTQTNLQEAVKAVDEKMSSWYGVCIPK
jgi:hypothetical protein